MGDCLPYPLAPGLTLHTLPSITVPLAVSSGADGGSLGPASGDDDANGTRPRCRRRSVVGGWPPTRAAPASGGARGRCWGGAAGTRRPWREVPPLFSRTVPG